MFNKQMLNYVYANYSIAKIWTVKEYDPRIITGGLLLTLRELPAVITT